MAVEPLADIGGAPARAVPPPVVDAAAARAAADALDAVAAVVQRHLEAWFVEVARLEAWAGARRHQFDLDEQAFLAEAAPVPETLRGLAGALRSWADEPLP